MRSLQYKMKIKLIPDKIMPSDIVYSIEADIM